MIQIVVGVVPGDEADKIASLQHWELHSRGGKLRMITPIDKQ
jgi:hypothetical protein